MQNELLNAAFISEKSAEILYENLSDLGEIFAEILSVRKNGLTLIKTYAKAKNLGLSNEQIQNAFLMPDSLQDALICALNLEIQLNKMYENFTQNLDDEELKDLFFRLWATSNNEYVVALKKALKAELQSDAPKAKAQETQNFSQILNAQGYENLLLKYQEDFNQIKEGLQNVVSGKASGAELAKILNNPNFSFFSGLALGALGMTAASKNLRKDETDE
ncbi:ferritin-like domain-containing protein [uncultured Campylobacter sp.]|uniref:ferritin-like domain-containing protein n=1 Tax=uncultured Campylobacter sp. TaxID=218934 RepID=UPI0025FBCC40|nr:ferritin-like domain-containing protein [uncultured Campylobacter sp.]